MYRIVLYSIISTCLLGVSSASGNVFTEARSLPEWCVYVTAGSVRQLAADPNEVATAVTRLRELGVTKVFLEVYRGDVVPTESLITVRDALRAKEFEVSGGIATVPGDGFGVRQEAPLGWFNWQNPKTQDDMRTIVENTAGLFNEFIIDDFFCTGDLSAESQKARGNRSWSDYRRDLMAGIAESVFIAPAKSVNPNITMIIKYPQWYDKFHEFGYDVARESPLFDKVWVGTETRGASTQRFGYTQAYMGFNNYRWIASIAGAKRPVHGSITATATRSTLWTRPIKAFWPALRRS